MSKETNIKMEAKKVNEETALQDLYEFIKTHVRKPGAIEEVAQEYPLLLEAIQDGQFFVIDEVPIFKLYEPIKTDSGDIDHDTLSFRTRVKPSVQERLSRGLDVQAQQILFAMRMFAYIIDKPKAYLDKYSKDDYKVIQEICRVFM
jgi:hypothetical protein